MNNTNKLYQHRRYRIRVTNKVLQVVLLRKDWVTTYNSPLVKVVNPLIRVTQPRKLTQTVAYPSTPGIQPETLPCQSITKCQPSSQLSATQSRDWVTLWTAERVFDSPEWVISWVSAECMWLSLRVQPRTARRSRGLSEGNCTNTELHLWELSPSNFSSWRLSNQLCFVPVPVHRVCVVHFFKNHPFLRQLLIY